MPHPLVDEVGVLVTRLGRITKQSQLAALAAEVQQLAVRLDGALVADEEIVSHLAAKDAQLRDIERRFGFNRDDSGQTMVVGTSRFNPQTAELVIRIPACAGMTDVPFAVACASGHVNGDELVILLELEIS